MSDIDDKVDDVSEGGDDLFGDDDGDDASQIEDNAPIPSDNDSDNDRRRSATPDSPARRSQRELSPVVQEEELSISRQTIYRHGLPKSDGNMQLVKIPHFLRVIPESYHESTPLNDWTIENSMKQIPTNIIRYRRNSQTGKLESNANIYRWSDGSTTVQVGEEHYDVQIKPQIPPSHKAYMPDRDANRYIAAAQEGMAQLLTVAHVSEEWSIRPDRKRVLEETEQLKERMSLANGGAKEGELIITTTVDPEMQKRDAELAEKERVRAQRKRENAQLRVEAGPGGFRKGAGNIGLGDLEGGRRAASGRKRGPGGGAKRSRGRNLDEDSEDEGRYGGEDYDKEDDFIAGSDEEVSEGENDDMLDDGDVEFETERPRAKKRQKRDSSNDDADTDADGELDADAPATTGDHGRRRARRVVSDEDDDE